MCFLLNIGEHPYKEGSPDMSKISEEEYEKIESKDYSAEVIELCYKMLNLV
jgi:hypothetical protein